MTTNCIKHNSETLSSQLNKFFTAWSQLPILVDHEIIQYKSLDPISLTKFIEELQVLMQKIHEGGMLANVWEIAGLKRNEVRIAGVLNWLLDTYGSHGQKHRLCAALLDSFSEQVKYKAKYFSMANFPTSDKLFDTSGKVRYRSVTEICPLGERENRVDIEISGDGVILIIEVKVDAQQGDSQLSRYHDIAKVKSQGRSWGVIYLTPCGDLPENARALSNTISIPWSSVSKTLHDYAKSLPSANVAKHYIDQYAQYIKTL